MISNYIYWVILSAFELIVEQIGKLIIKKTNIKVNFFNVLLIIKKIGKIE